MTLTVRHKLFAIAGLTALLPAVAALQGASAATIARALLALAALGGLVWWVLRARQGPGAFKLAPRLKVVSRVGLSPRSGLTLVEVDGRPWLVVHGDGFVRLRPTRQPRPVAPTLKLVAKEGP